MGPRIKDSNLEGLVTSLLLLGELSRFLELFHRAQWLISPTSR
jgi:hypothetical protein